MLRDLTESEWTEIEVFIVAGNDAAAIKAIQDFTGADHLAAQRLIAQRKEERGIAPDTGRSGCLGVLLLGALVIFAAANALRRIA